MGYDLSLTNTGDLSFTTSNFNSRTDIFDFNFHVAPSDSLLFNFVIESNNKPIADNIKKARADISINTYEDLDTVENPEVGQKVYIADEDIIYRVTGINEMSYLDDQVVIKVGDIQPIQVSPNFDFEFYTYSLKYDKTNKTISNKAYTEQAIRLRLDTESGTIRGNETMGANLFKLMHSSMQSSRLLSNISEQVKNAISDILPNCTVEAYIINSDYFNYHNTIKIVIVNNEEVYYYYI